MKIRLTFFCSLLLLLFSGCDNDDNNESLPAETQIGANTVGCLVNGNVFLSHGEGLSPEVNCFYQFVDGEYYFSMNFADLRGTGFKEVFVNVRKIELFEGQIHDLTKNSEDNADYEGAGGGYSSSIANTYMTNNMQTGQLIITRIDVQNSIISGTFWFDAINEEGEIVEIREGRFDWNY